jgi:glycine cleavage system H protein
MTDPHDAVHYKRARFATRLPADRLYTASHFWIFAQQPGMWRVGLTKFAARMLGDIVDLGFDVRQDEAVQLGQAIGWLEGFKARSDLYTVVEGRFASGNAALDIEIDLIDADRYAKGWLYEVEGRPDPDAVDVGGYVSILDATIDRLRGKIS